MKSNDRNISTDKIKENNESEKYIISEESEPLINDNDIVSDSIEIIKKCKKDKKPNKNYSKQFKCDKCDKRYTWYSGLSNHKRFVHNKQKDTMGLGVGPDSATERWPYRKIVRKSVFFKKNQNYLKKICIIYFLDIPSRYAKILGETNFQAREFPRSG